VINVRKRSVALIVEVYPDSDEGYPNSDIPEDDSDPGIPIDLDTPNIIPDFDSDATP
jgi:hypothetical protein